MQSADVPLFPRPFKRGPRRTLAFAYANQRRIYTEHGEIIDYDDHRALFDNAKRLRLTVYVDTFSSGLVVDAMASGAMATWNPNAKKISGVVFRNRGANVHILGTSAWPKLLKAGQLKQLRSLLDACDVGDYATPASVGQAMMARMFPAMSPKLRRPTWEAWQDLYDNLTGGRAELHRPGYYLRALEEDIDDAYPSALRSIPGGDCRRLLSDPLFSGSADKWWFARYRWLLPKRPLLPLLGLRDTEGHTFYPSTPHKWFDGWYTKEEIEIAYKMGYELQFVTGWGFSKLLDVFTEWSAHIGFLRGRFPKPISDWIKLIGVAGIGRFGRNRTSYEVVPPDTRLTPDEWTRVQSVLDQNTSEHQFLILERDEPNRNDYLIQVALKVHADIRLATFMRALPHRRAGTLIATNFDAIYVTAQPSAGDAVMTAEREMLEDHAEPYQHALDGNVFRWKKKEHTNARFPRTRWLLSDQAIKTPGVKHQ